MDKLGSSCRTRKYAFMRTHKSEIRTRRITYSNARDLRRNRSRSRNLKRLHAANALERKSERCLCFWEAFQVDPKNHSRWSFMQIVDRPFKSGVPVLWDSRTFQKPDSCCSVRQPLRKPDMSSTRTFSYENGYLNDRGRSRSVRPAGSTKTTMFRQQYIKLSGKFLCPDVL